MERCQSSAFTASDERARSHSRDERAFPRRDVFRAIDETIAPPRADASARAHRTRRRRTSKSFARILNARCFFVVDMTTTRRGAHCRCRRHRPTSSFVDVRSTRDASTPTNAPTNAVDTVFVPLSSALARDDPVARRTIRSIAPPPCPPTMNSTKTTTTCARKTTSRTSDAEISSTPIV